MTFRSRQTTHSADWKVSTGAEGSVSSGADGADSLLSSSSEGALAAPFIEPAIIHFSLHSAHQDGFQNTHEDMDMVGHRQ